MGLLHNGVTDVNTENPAEITAAQKALQQLVSSANLKFDTNEYQHLADGSLWLHQAWSGDMAVTPSYAPKGTKPTAFAYWWPSDGRGPDQQRHAWRCCKGAKNPVLAHLFLNHLIDEKQAFSNFSYIGYQQPLNAMTPEAVVKKGYLAPNLHQHADPRAAVQERLCPGHAQPGRRRRCGRTPGRRSSRRERNRRRQTAPRYWRAFALPGGRVAAAVRGHPRLRGAGDRHGPGQLPVPADPGLEPGHTGTPATVSKAFSGSLPGGEYWPAVRNTLVYVSRLAGPLLRHRLPGRLLRRAPRQALQDAADRAAGDPVLGQLPAADAGLDRPALPRRLRQPDPQRARASATRRTG